MRLEKASYKAIVYACKMFHYAKSVPVNVTGYSVFNDANKWCGVVIFGSGANNNLAANFNLSQGQAAELVRVALNGNHGSTSKALALSLKLIKKDLPLCRLIISYADCDQNHFGTIYQATNWFYTGTQMENQHDSSWLIKGKRYHGRIVSDFVKSKGGLKGLTREQFLKKYYDIDAKPYITKGKIKYIFPLDKNLISMCKALSKPYPKKLHAIEVLPVAQQASSLQEGFDSTLSLKNKDNAI